MATSLNTRALLGIDQFGPAVLGDPAQFRPTTGPAMAPVAGAPQGQLAQVAASMAPAQTPQKLSLLEKLDALFGGDVGDALAHIRERKRATAQEGADRVTRQQIGQMMFPDDPVKAAAYAASPKAMEDFTARQEREAYIAGLPADQQAEARLNPGEFAKDRRDLGKPTFMSTPTGIVGLTKADPAHPMQITTAKRLLPFGWEEGEDGVPRPIEGGPADPAYIGRVAGVKRDAVVSRPTPSRARAGGSSAPAPIRVTAPPWERKW